MARVSKPGGKRDHPVARRLERQVEVESKAVVPSGSILLNLACSDSYRAAWQLGRMVNLIGDSSSGKTYLALEMLAQCCQRKEFDNHRIIYDDAEHALSMDIAALFGDELDERLEFPKFKVKVGKDEWEECNASRTVEDFHFNVMDALEAGPCIYVLDSFDSLTAEADEDKIEEMRAARAKGVEVSGSYRMAKPKKASELLQSIIADLEKSNSFLLIISQTRANVEPGTFEKRTRSGGKALKFYASHEIWLAVKSKTRQKVKNSASTRVVGASIVARVSKNKLTGTSRDVSFDHRHGYGCDDIQSAIDFLVAEKGGISKSGAKVTWRGTTYTTTNQMIDAIEDGNMEKLLFQDVQERWVEIEEELKPNRKPKYGG